MFFCVLCKPTLKWMKAHNWNEKKLSDPFFFIPTISLIFWHDIFEGIYEFFLCFCGCCIFLLQIFCNPNGGVVRVQKPVWPLQLYFASFFLSEDSSNTVFGEHFSGVYLSFSFLCGVDSTNRHIVSIFLGIGLQSRHNPVLEFGSIWVFGFHLCFSFIKE